MGVGITVIRLLNLYYVDYPVLDAAGSVMILESIEDCEYDYRLCDAYIGRDDLSVLSNDYMGVAIRNTDCEDLSVGTFGGDLRIYLNDFAVVEDLCFYNDYFFYALEDRFSSTISRFRAF